jgi:hypothetical protein
MESHSLPERVSTIEYAVLDEQSGLVQGVKKNTQRIDDLESDAKVRDRLVTLGGWLLGLVLSGIEIYSKLNK